jgi:hypothetical protein
MVFRLPSMVQKVMGEIVANIAKYAATEDGCCGVPIVEEDCVCEFPEGCCESNEECRWHNESIFVHWKVMMNAMEKEMECEAYTVVR